MPDGIYTQAEMIDSIICDMDKLEVKGIENAAIYVGCMQKLIALRKGMKNHDDQNREGESV